MKGIYWLASYPKSGNTWFRVFLSNLKCAGDTPVDINSLDTGTIASSRRWIDETLGFDSADLTTAEIERMRQDVYRWSLAESATEYGYHKTHDAFVHTATGEPMLSREATCGALYIIRNPLDVAVSAATHWGVSIDQAIASMGNPRYGVAAQRDGITLQVPQRLLSWSGHVSSWVDAPGLDCCVVRYEDMLRDPGATFTRAARFLRLSADDHEISRAIEHSEFSALRRQEQANGFKERADPATCFFRSGTEGNWKSALSSLQVSRIIEQHSRVMTRFGYLDDVGSPH